MSSSVLIRGGGGLRTLSVLYIYKKQKCVRNLNLVTIYFVFTNVLCMYIGTPNLLIFQMGERTELIELNFFHRYHAQRVPSQN